MVTIPKPSDLRQALFDEVTYLTTERQPGPGALEEFTQTVAPRLCLGGAFGRRAHGWCADA
jgi:hypothetical protein